MRRESLHIAHYTNVYKPMKNGVVSSVDSFRRAQLEQGHAVYIVAPTPRDRTYIQERFVFNIPAITLPNQEYPFALPYERTITRVLGGIQPDILHTHHPVGLGSCAGLWSKRLGIPLIFTFHTWYEDFSHYFSRYFPFVTEEHVGRFIRYWIRKFVKRCHHIVAPSEYTYRRILEVYGEVLDEENISVVPTGIDTTMFSKYRKSEARAALGWATDQRYLVSCGRLSREKNFDVLLEGLSRMEEEAKLVILGEGDLRPELEKHIEELGLRGSVELPGNVDKDEVARHLAAADLFAFASPNETQGLVVLEAMAAGTPAVVVWEGGVKDYVQDGVNGIAADSNPEALAQALDRALRATDLSCLRQRAYQTASALSERNQARRMAEVYAGAIRKKKAATGQKRRGLALVSC
jgi:1,2-diacylglycerol 3-alpha-glucosyltransferase